MRLIHNLTIFMLLTALGNAMLGCAPEAPGATGKHTLVIGSVLSKSGPAAAYGNDADRGARLALKELRAQADLPFEIRYISYDDRSDKTEAAKVARALIDADGVNAILGPAISPSALSVGKLAQERRIPVVATSATQDEVTASTTYDRTYVFRVCFNDSYQGKVLAQFARQDLGIRRVAVIYDNSLSYSIGLARTFREQFEARGGVVAYEENFSVTDSDFSALIDKVAAFPVDALFIAGWDENVGPMLKQAQNRWDNFILLGADGWVTHRLLELAGGNTGTSFALSHFINDDPSPRVQALNRAYEAEYGELPTAFSVLGYDAMRLIVDAARRAPTFDGPALRDALAATSDLDLVTGHLRFDSHRNPQKDAVVVKVEPDHFAFYKRIRL